MREKENVIEKRLILPSVLQPYISTLMQTMPYSFHSRTIILINRAMIALSNLFVTTELSSLFPRNL